MFHQILYYIFGGLLLREISAFVEKGPNVCVIEHIPGTSHKIFYECKNWKSRTVCGQKPILKYDCCDGYSRIEDTDGCVRVNALKNVLETARQLGSRKFVRYIEQSRVKSQFVQDGAITLFAPTDEAMQKIEEKMNQNSQNFSVQLDNLINYHTLDKRLPSSSFEADVMVNTKFNGNKLRINQFSSWINTVNCISIMNNDNEATNGIVHVISSALNPDETPQKNVADILLQDGRFRLFSQALENTGILKTLRKSKHPVSVLAPTDKAFQNIRIETFHSILNDDQAGEAMIRNHILPHTLCLPAIIGQHKLKTESSEKLMFNCGNSKDVTVNGNATLREFISGENGVVYVMDSVILPDRAKSLVKLMEQEKLDTFLKLMRSTRLDETFEGARHYTLFVPSEKAMSQIPKNKLDELFLNSNRAKQFILHHAVQEKLKNQNLYDNQVIMSLDEVHPITIHISRKSMLVDCSLIEKADREARNGILHVINKPLYNLDDDVMSTLKANSSLSIFMEAVGRTPLRRDIQNNKFKTIFVPINQAFLMLGQRKLDRLMTNQTYLNKVLQNHFLYHFVPKDTIMESLYYNFPTANGDVELFKENNVFTVNNIQVIQPNLLTKNGLVHLINEVLTSKNENET